MVGSRYAALIDTGYSRSYLRILRALREIGVEPSTLRYIIPTHAHLDHCGATGKLVEYYSNSKVLAHEKAYRHIIDPTKLIESARSFFGEETFSKFGEVRPVSEDRVTVMHDDEELDLGDSVIRCIYAPGHAPHQMALMLVKYKYVVSADVFATRYPFLNLVLPNAPPPRFDLEEAIKSMWKVYSFSPRLMLAAHYGPFLISEHTVNEEVETYRQWVREIEAMRRAGLDADQVEKTIVSRLERKLGTPLHPSARGTIRMTTLGILQYLASR